MPPDFASYQQEIRLVFREYVDAIERFKAYRGWSLAYRDYIMFRTVLEAAGYLGIPPHRHGQSFRIGYFTMRDGGRKGVTLAEFVEVLGYSWNTWSSKSTLFFKVEDLVAICNKAHELGRRVNDQIYELELYLRCWSESSVPLIEHPSVSWRQSSKTLQAALTRILVSPMCACVGQLLTIYVGFCGLDGYSKGRILQTLIPVTTS